jgi:hypothetical protein
MGVGKWEVSKWVFKKWDEEKRGWRSAPGKRGEGRGEADGVFAVLYCIVSYYAALYLSEIKLRMKA